MVSLLLTVQLGQRLWYYLREGFPGNLLFQQDVAQLQFHLGMREFLDNQLPGSWMGHAGMTALPTGSPDISSFSGFFQRLSIDHQFHSPCRSCEAAFQMWLLKLMQQCYSTHGSSFSIVKTFVT
jgi:hypothetical protein